MGSLSLLLGKNGAGGGDHIVMAGGRHVAIAIIIIVALWHWPQVLCQCCLCHCAMALSLLLLSWHCGTGHRCCINVVVPWPCHCCHSCCCCCCVMAMTLSLLLSWCHGSGHRHHFLGIVAVVWPCCCCHHCCRYGVALSLSSLLVLWWDRNGGGVTVVVSGCCHCCLHPGIGHGHCIIVIVITCLCCGTRHGHHVIVVIDVAGGAGVGSWMCMGAGCAWGLDVCEWCQTWVLEGMSAGMGGAGHTIVILALSPPLPHPPVISSSLLCCLCSIVNIAVCMCAADMREGCGWGQVGVKEWEWYSPFVIIIVCVCCCGDWCERGRWVGSAVREWGSCVYLWCMCMRTCSVNFWGNRTYHSLDCWSHNWFCILYIQLLACLVVIDAVKTSSSLILSFGGSGGQGTV